MSVLPSAPFAIQLERVGKRYRCGLLARPVTALHDISLQLPSGQVLGLLGPNGSGKSTTLKLLAGLVRPTSGRCLIRGIEAGTDAARALIGFAPELPQFPGHLTGFELLQYCAALSSMDRARAKSRAMEVLAWSGLGDAGARRLASYSKGMTQRLALAQAILHDPAVVLLDEPSSGLDPAGRMALNELVRQLARDGKTVVFSSHLLAQAEQLCDRVAILGGGRLLAEGTPESLLGEMRPVHAGPSPLEKLYLEKVVAHG